MGVDLGRADVGVAEHLLQRTQVTPARQQMGGERVPERVRAHAPLQAGAAGVALDDPVQALARQAASALVDEDVGLVADAHQPRAAVFQVDRQRLHRLGADRHEPLLGALAAGPQHPGLEVDLGQLERDRLARTQAAGVHGLQQRPVAQRRRRGPARLGQQAVDLVACQHLGQAPPRAGRAQLGGGIVADDLLAAQVAVERAQARDLALQRGGRHRRLAVAPVGQLGHERRQVARSDLERVAVAAGQEHPELLQVGAVGLQGVARQAALELQGSQELQGQVGEPALDVGCLGDGHVRPYSPSAGASPAAGRALSAGGRSPRSRVRAKPEQGDERLGVL